MNRLEDFFCKDFSNQRRVWFSLTSTSRRDCEKDGTKNLRDFC
jgi:hypothetical protein